jgi:hypothetical protein
VRQALRSGNAYAHWYRSRGPEEIDFVDTSLPAAPRRPKEPTTVGGLDRKRLRKWAGLDDGYQPKTTRVIRLAFTIAATFFIVTLFCSSHYDLLYASILATIRRIATSHRHGWSDPELLGLESFDRHLGRHLI